MTEIRNSMTTILILINWANLFPGYIWRDVMMAGDCWLCVTHSVFLMFWSLLTKIWFPMFMLKWLAYSLPHPQTSGLRVFEFCSLKKTKSFSFQFRETDEIGLLAAYKALSTSALQRHYLCCRCLTRSSWAKKLLSSHKRGEAPCSWTRSERGDLNIRLLKSSDECLQCDFNGSNPLLLS